MELRGRSFIVTGASRGIGRGLAELLAREGARVAISGRNRENLDAAARALRAHGAELVSVAGDVGDDRDAAALAAAAFEAFGSIDVLVNNAAILSKRAPVVETPARVWEEVLRTNVIGTANMIRHVLPRMERQRSGLIVNLSSGWGRSAAGFVAPYCASKFAVEALTQSVSEESGPGVVVFALNPGVIATDMLAAAFEGDVSHYPAPAELAPRWRALFARVKPSWHGTSRDLDDFA